MLKKAAIIAVSIVALASVNLVLAEENGDNTNTDTKNTQEQIKNEWRQNREQRKAEMEQKREQWKAEREQELENLKAQKEKFKEMREKFTEERCAKIEERIKNRTEWFNNSKEKHTTVYANLLNRIDKFITRFDNFNAANATKIDPAKIQKLKDDRAQLVILIDNFKTSFSDYFTKLNGAKNFTCGHSEGEFKNALLDARTYLKSVHENAAAIRKYVRETILPDILAIKKEIAKIRGENENQEADENDNEDGS